MKRVFAVLFSLVLICASAPALAGCISLLGAGKACGAGGGGTPFTVDGPPVGGTGTASSFALGRSATI
jgi:hypothetical protein